jgi:hypothetical protein
VTDIPEDYFIDMPEASVDEYLQRLPKWLEERGLKIKKSGAATVTIFEAGGRGDVFTIAGRDLVDLLLSLPGGAQITVALQAWGPRGSDTDASGAFDQEPRFAPPEVPEVPEVPPQEEPQPAPEPQREEPREEAPQAPPAPPRQEPRQAPAPPREVRPSPPPATPPAPPPTPAPVAPGAQVYRAVDQGIRTVADRIETAGRAVLEGLAGLFGRRR